MDTKVWHDLLSFFSFQLILKLDRAQVADARVQPDPVVIAFDVAEDLLPGVSEILERSDRLERICRDEFGLEPREKTLDLGRCRSSCLFRSSTDAVRID